MVLYSSTAGDGNMSILAPANRRKFFDKIGITERQVVNLHLAHSNKVADVFSEDGGKLFERTDGLITNSRNIYLALLVGDCLPVAIADPVNNSIGLIHAGWRGLENGVIKNAVKLLEKKLKAKSKNLIVYIGSHICQKHYEVKNDLVKKFKDYPESVRKIGNKYYLDLGKIAKKQLIDLGVGGKNIRIEETCTFENRNLFSYRRDKTKDRNLFLLTLS